MYCFTCKEDFESMMTLYLSGVGGEKGKTECQAGDRTGGTDGTAD